MDHAEGDRRINEGKQWLQRKNGNNSGGRAVTAAVTVVTAGKWSTVDTMSVMIKQKNQYTSTVVYICRYRFVKTQSYNSECA